MLSAADEIRLTLPATAGHARVARLALTGLASRNGFTYDEVEDVRIAVGETFSILVADGPAGSRILLRCRVGDGQLEVDAETLPPRPLPAVDDLSRQILAAVTAGSTIDHEHGRISFRAAVSEPR